MKPYMYKTMATACISAFMLTACNNQPQGNQNDVATPVSVMELKKKSISQFVNTTGTANPVYGVEINSQITGDYRLMNNPATGKPFKMGDRVTKGQVIIRLEDAEYENSIAIDSKELNLEIAEQEQQKQKLLYEKGGVTLREMRNTDVNVTNARHEVENARLGIQKMSIRAPFTGVIVNLPHYTSGVRVEQGKPMVGIMDYAQMYMDINLPESAIGSVSAQQPVHITHYTLPNDTLKGTIAELSPAISMETRTFKGKLNIDNKELKLRPGMFVKADIVVSRAESSIVIPKNIIQSQWNNKYVYVVEKNTAYQRRITTGLEDENNVEVLEGLNENDNLVVRGYETLRDNSRVKVRR
ncbi:efflux RND transporter periplasmic adaptor subunit [Bacteroides sp. 519]|uniref:efflux RND transporter periplasmic adaptor subunit n=1 Tax=Bacteroides sp. 519 TaxID=2302937 RepID=UPI0013D64A9E|nr:efflux RND transporter periplasmic adaptor subunit [Bacteroides sp. 519]NDV56579.1 efflux RND transporter periplasmic adaptor subunit [Bacteroides sp. 519]